jgi:hypothetical protein
MKLVHAVAGIVLLGLVGGAIAVNIHLHNRLKGAEAHLTLLGDTVVAMGAHVMLQDITIEQLQKEVKKYSGTRTSY